MLHKYVLNAQICILSKTLDTQIVYISLNYNIHVKMVYINHFIFKNKIDNVYFSVS